MIFNVSENLAKEKLDGLVLSIELTLISVVQGVALAALGAASTAVLAEPNFGHWFYIFSGLLFILIFWSGAIIHALSFIDWPLDIWHNFLYFLATFVEVMAFGQLSNPFLWFIFIGLFFSTAMVLYVYDLGLMKKHMLLFTSEKEKKLYSHIISEQLFEMRYIIPSGIIFNFLAAFVIYFYPDIFIRNGYHFLIAFFQVTGLSLFLFNSMKSFRKRSQLISDCL